MKAIYLTILLLISCCLAQAQPPEERYLKQAKNFFERGEYAKADMNCDAGLKRNPHSGEAYLLKAKCQYAWDHHRCNWESKKFLDSADKYSEDKYEVYLMKVINSTCCGDHSKAEFYLRQLNEFENKDIQYDFVNGYYLYIKRDFEASLSLLKKVLTTSKDITISWNANYYTGYIYYYQNRFDDAIKHFENCLKVTPASKEINMILGAAYLQKLEYKKAIEYHDEAVKAIQEEDEQKVENAKYYFTRGVALLKSGNGKKAMKDFEMATACGKEDAELFFYTGQAQLELGEYCAASGSFYETELKVQGNEEVNYSFHISDVYFNLLYVNAVAYCDNMKKEHLDLARKYFDKDKSGFDLMALKVLHSSYLIQADSGSGSQSTEICKNAKEGEGTTHEELAKVAVKISKSFCP